MSTITERLVTRFDRWLDRVTMTDDRYICGACDDRFRNRALGFEHVLRCHPEYQGVVVYENDQQVRPAPTRLPVGLGAAKVPVAVPVVATR